jgi:hypothetical protein
MDREHKQEQRLMELFYGLLPEAEAMVLRAQIESDEDVKRAFERIKRQVTLFSEAALHDLPASPAADEKSTISDTFVPTDWKSLSATLSQADKEGLVGRPQSDPDRDPFTGRGGENASSRPTPRKEVKTRPVYRGRPFSWTVSGVACLILIAAIWGRSMTPPGPSPDAETAICLQVTAPDALRPGEAQRFTVQAERLDGSPAAVPVQLSLRDEEGRTIYEQTLDSADDGSVIFEVTNPEDLVANAQFHVRALEGHDIETGVLGQIAVRDHIAMTESLLPNPQARREVTSKVNPLMMVPRGGHPGLAAEDLAAVDLTQADVIPALPPMAAAMNMMADPPGPSVRSMHNGGVRSFPPNEGMADVPPHMAHSEGMMMAAPPAPMGMAMDGGGGGQRTVNAHVPAMDSMAVDKPFELIPIEPDDLFHDPNREIADGVSVDLSRAECEFYPEGGVLTPGVDNRFYFRVVDKHGHGLRCSYRLTNRSAYNPIMESTTDSEGNGVFRFTPVGNQYNITIPISKRAGQISERQCGILLDEFTPSYAALSVLNPVLFDDEPLHVEIRSTKDDIPLVLSASRQGVSIAQNSIHSKSNETVTVELDLPEATSGLIRLQLFDYQHSPPRLMASRDVYRFASPMGGEEQVELHLNVRKLEEESTDPESPSLPSRLLEFEILPPELSTEEGLAWLYIAPASYIEDYLQRYGCHEASLSETIASLASNEEQDFNSELASLIELSLILDAETSRSEDTDSIPETEEALTTVQLQRLDFLLATGSLPVEKLHSDIDQSLALQSLAAATSIPIVRDNSFAVRQAAAEDVLRARGIRFKSHDRRVVIVLGASIILLLILVTCRLRGVALDSVSRYSVMVIVIIACGIALIPSKNYRDDLDSIGREVIVFPEYEHTNAPEESTTESPADMNISFTATDHPHEEGGVEGIELSETPHGANIWSQRLTLKKEGENKTLVTLPPDDYRVLLLVIGPNSRPHLRTYHLHVP